MAMLLVKSNSLLCIIFSFLLVSSQIFTFVVMIFAQSFSQNAKAGMYCDHDKVRTLFSSGKFTSSQTMDSTNQKKPFTMQSYLHNIECPVSSTESDDCGKCNSAAGGTMKTFAKIGETNTCQSEDILTAAKQTYIMNLVDDATTILKKIVSAPDFLGGLIPNPSSGTRCGANSANVGGLLLPTAHLAPQLGVHYMVYVTAGPPSPSLVTLRNRSAVSSSVDTSEPLVWGATCGYTQNGDARPIVGHLHFAPRAVDADPTATTSDSKRLKDLYFVLHQMMHMLGWSLPLLPKGYAASYLATSKTAYVSSSIPYRNWAFESRKAVSSPKVRTETRNFFDCQSSMLVGAEFGEAQGDSHLAKRIFADDFMSEPLPWDPVPHLSRLSFALLEDSGFWSVNYSFIDANYNSSLFGKGKGCTFPNEQCRYPTTDWEEFCWSTTDEECGIDLLSGGPCDIMSHTSSTSSSTTTTTTSTTSANCVPTSSQSYFRDDCTKGGPDINDYCPTPARVNSFSQCNDLSNNKNPDGAYKLGSAYSNSARCMQGTVIRVGSQPRTPFLETRCVELRCGWDLTVTPNQKTLFVQLFNGSLTIVCPVAGGQIDVGLYSTNYSGYYVCPPYSDSFCTSKSLVDAGSVATFSTPIVDGTLISGSNSCQARVDCATKVYNDFVANIQSAGAASCSEMSRKLQNCFLGQCTVEKSTFVKAKLSQNCTGNNGNFRKFVANICSDGLAGAMDLCQVVSSSSGAGKVLSSIILIMGLLLLVNII